jgi:NAD(P)-dependent dehydrogenase (short-subunit alcohol dehydrogenase family)
MNHVILTGASRGIGAALLRALPPDVHVHAIARGPIAARANTTMHALDLATDTPPHLDVHGATLVHCAGIWPSTPELVNGKERAWIVNCVAPLAWTRTLLNEKRLSRILVIGAGLMIKGRFSSTQTPIGADFHWMRTYASTKLAFAVAMRDLARAHPNVDVAVIHPGVVNTELGARGGPVGWLLRRVKKKWEDPDVTAQKLVRVLARDRWSPPGDARWFVEEREEAWPAIADEAAAEVRKAILQK